MIWPSLSHQRQAEMQCIPRQTVLSSVVAQAFAQMPAFQTTLPDGDFVRVHLWSCPLSHSPARWAVVFSGEYFYLKSSYEWVSLVSFYNIGITEPRTFFILFLWCPAAFWPL